MGDAAAFESRHKEPVKSAPIMEDSKEFSRRDGYILIIISFIFPRLTADGENLLYEALIAKPDQPAPTIIVINGHGKVGGEGHGQAQITMFNEGARAACWQKRLREYRVYEHDPCASRASRQGTDYSIIWARLADKALDKLIPNLPTVINCCLQAGKGQR
ncbi:hypothetical protein [Tardiphaga sp. 803_E3_N1_3]|uniref:hypothetical protein n=1 Tax=Tardiphaga sp. 803_E3_N1_3 TaxID=3240785 RepID=UPI003F271442